MNHLNPRSVDGVMNKTLQAENVFNFIGTSLEILPLPSVSCPIIRFSFFFQLVLDSLLSTSTFYFLTTPNGYFWPCNFHTHTVEINKHRENIYNTCKNISLPQVQILILFIYFKFPWNVPFNKPYSSSYSLHGVKL